MATHSLQALLAEAGPLTPVPDVPISGIALDSRQVQPGDVFVALVGGQVDGHLYVSDALERGAAAVLGSQPPPLGVLNYVQVADTRRALARLSAAFYAYPARKLTLIGITGTDGKTTTANLLYRILLETGLKSGMITTVNALIGEQELDTGFHVTTPEAPDVQRYLSQMVEAGLSHAILETTSHGLAQERVGAIEFDVAVVTNITHEHLDYHGSYEEYRAAKGRLFEALKPGGAAILNRDDSSYKFLAGISPARRISYGLHPEADLRATRIEHSAKGLRFAARSKDREWQVRSKLIGDYNVSNCLAALATVLQGLHLDEEAALKGIAALEAVPGRMERIDLGQDFSALVDFAHTPNALENALQTARQLTDKRVIAVFGSAGLRDRKKRRMMAQSSAQLADLTILTAEDPRTESLEDILEEMAKGAQRKGGVEGKTFWRVPDRGAAISFALLQAKPGDLVIVLGKGHEQSMCFGETEFPWDDRTALRAALAEYLGVDGPQMPYLPTQD